MENGTMEYYRAELDKIDKLLIPLLKDRMAISVKIGQYKKANGIPVYDKTREETILNRVEATAGPIFAKALRSVYEAILSESRRLQ